MKTSRMKSVHPGEILLEEFLAPMNLTCEKIAEGVKLPAEIIMDIVEGKRDLDASTSLRLARYFSTSPQFWFGLQMDYDLENAATRDGAAILSEVKVYESPD